MDENEFYRQASIRICGNLEIEEALYSTMQFMRETMPVSRMFLEHYSKDLKTNRTIAIATLTEAKKVDLLTPLSPKAHIRALTYYDKTPQKVYLFGNKEIPPMGQEMMKFHNVDLSSIIVLPLQAGEQKLGLLVLGSEGEEKFTQEQAELISLLSEAFSIAMSNTLKHRSELKLFDRDFFWEVTMRICGNLEVEKGLQGCIELLSQHIPADSLYLQRHMHDLGSMHIVSRATTEKCEELDILIPFPEHTKAQIAELAKAWEAGVLPPVIVVNKPKEDPYTRHLLETLEEPSSSVMILILAVEKEVAGALVILAKGDNRFKEEHARLFSSLKSPFFVAKQFTVDQSIRNSTAIYAYKRAFTA
jgi:transcriptional regulator with GAF, ATPase, and Fis domain